MKNLKKALSLVLSTAMMLGMMVVGTGASYTDVDSDDYVEAIEVMQAVGIMEGDGNGFNPDKKVTRHEMAVVMANVLNLDVDDFKGAKLNFTDVADWAAPYVAACYADGIMAGTSATTFGGDQNVTAAQAALMVMKALGYFQFQPDFGEDWMLATIKQASEIKLFDGMKVGATTELTRNDVAKLVLNGLEADVVDYSGSQGTNIALPDGTSILTGYTIKYYAKADTENYNYNSATLYTHDQETLQLTEKLYEDDLTKAGGTDVFGRPTTIWEYKVKQVGEYAKAPDGVFNNKLAKNALYNFVGKTVVEDIESTAAADDAARLTVWTDGKKALDAYEGTASNIFDKKDSGSIKTAALGNLTGNGTTTEVYVDNDTNAVTLVIVNKYVVQAQADFNTKKEEVTVALADTTTSYTLYDTTLEADDFDVEDVVEDDYLIVTMAWENGTKYDIQSVEPATVVSGMVNAWTANKNITVDGTKYSYNFTTDATAQGTQYLVGETAAIVTDGEFVMFVDDATVAPDKFVFVKDIAKNGNFTDADFIAQAIFADGTSKVINIKDKVVNDIDTEAKTAVDEDNTRVGWYAYTVNSSDVYTLIDVTVPNAEATTASSTAVIANSTAIYTAGQTQVGNLSGITANAATTFIVIDDDDVITTYEGVANAPTIKTKATGAVSVQAEVVTNKDGNVAKFVIIDAADCVIDGAKKGSDLIYMLKFDGKYYDNVDNTYYNIYKALVNGEEAVVNVADDVTVVENRLYTDVKYNDKGQVSAMNIVDAGDDYTAVEASLGNLEVKYADGVLTIGGTNYVVNADCTINLIVEAGCDEILDDDDADYELYLDINANALKNALKGYTVVGNYNAQTDDDNGSLLALYVTVTGATEI